MKPLIERDPFRVGVVAMVFAALVGAGIVVLSVVSFGTRSYTAVLEHTAGLRVSEDVQVFGVSVGEVKQIELAGDVVRVTFVLDEAIELGSDTTAEVKVATLLGTHYLLVHPQGHGSLKADTIPIEQTSVPYNLQDVLEQGSKKLQELDPVLLARALTQMSSTLQASSDDVGPALEGVARLSEVISRRSDDAGKLFAAARTVTDQLASDSGDIVGLMKQTNLVLAEINSRRAAIHRLLVETTRLAQNLAAVVSQTKDDVGPALGDLNLALATLRSEDKTLKHVLEVMAPAVRYVANATGSGPWTDLFSHGPALPADDAKCQLEGC